MLWFRIGCSMSPQSLGCWSGMVAQPAKLCLSSLPTEGVPGSAQQVIQVDRDTVLVSFEREFPRIRVVGWWRVVVRKALWVCHPPPTSSLPVQAV